MLGRFFTKVSRNPKTVELVTSAFGTAAQAAAHSAYDKYRENHSHGFFEAGSNNTSKPTQSSSFKPRKLR